MSGFTREAQAQRRSRTVTASLYSDEMTRWLDGEELTARWLLFPASRLDKSMTSSNPLRRYSQRIKRDATDGIALVINMWPSHDKIYAPNCGPASVTFHNFNIACSNRLQSTFDTTAQQPPDHDLDTSKQPLDIPPCSIGCFTRCRALWKGY